MFTQIKTAAAASSSTFVQDTIGATALLIILFAGLHLPGPF